jgi:hypothetical protein
VTYLCLLTENCLRNFVSLIVLSCDELAGHGVPIKESGCVKH